MGGFTVLWFYMNIRLVNRHNKMVSQIVGENLEVLQINTYVRGYYAYMDLWTPVQDEMLILIREPTNMADKNAVAV